MRVLYHIGAGVVGGAETHLAYLINSLPDYVTPLVTYDSHHMEKFIFTRIKTKFVHRIFAANDLKKKIATFQPDIIQLSHCPKFYECLRRVNTTAKIIEVVHNQTSFPWDATTYGKERTSVLVCVSEDARKHYVSIMGDSLRTVLIPNGVDTGIFKPGPERPRPARLTGGFCGRLEGGDGKGVNNLVEIVSKFPVNFQLVGYDFGGFRQKLKDNSSFQVIGHTADIAEYYKKWDFFVSCSPKEGFGLAIAEALACGLPCIILECGGICRHIEHMKHAYIAKDLDDVKRGIELLLAGKLSHLRPLDVDLSSKTMTKKYLELYEELIEENRKAGIKISSPPPKKVLEATDYVLGVVPEGWHGIRRAIGARVDEICTPEKAVNIAQEKRPGTIIFGGFMASWYPVAKTLKKILAPKIIITFHGTAMMNEFGEENRAGLVHAISAAKEGIADLLSFPHEGVARAMNFLHKVNAVFEPNILTWVEKPNVGKLKGLHISVFGTGFPWKNVDTQILAAASTPGLTTLHLQNLRNPSFADMLGIAYRIHPYYSKRDEFYRIAAQMTINLAVTITECYGYFALESLMLGVPAIVGATTPSMRMAQGALKKCIVNYIDDPAAISDAILAVLDDYENVLEEGISMVRKLIL